MTKYFLKRIILALLSLLIIATMVYFLLGLTKTSPINEENFSNNPEAFLKELQALGLDKPIGERFIKYVTDIFTGKGFGIIYRADLRNTSIPLLFFKPLTLTLWFTIPAFLLSTTLGIGLGIWAGYKKGTWIDTTINTFVVIFIGIPGFILAIIALTTGNWLGLPTAFIRIEDGGYKQMILSIILPITVMTLSSLGLYTYATRNEVLSVLSSNQVTIARAKGLDEWDIFTKHVLRNSSLALTPLILNSFLVLLVSSVVIETFFQIPGTSSIIINSIRNSEYNIVMFYTIFFVFLTLLMGIIIDVIFVFLDPRIKYNSASELKLTKILKAKLVRSKKQRLNNYKMALLNVEWSTEELVVKSEPVQEKTINPTLEKLSIIVQTNDHLKSQALNHDFTKELLNQELSQQDLNEQTSELEQKGDDYETNI